MDKNKTQPLPTNWRIRYVPTLPEVRTRYPVTAASVAVTQSLPRV